MKYFIFTYGCQMNKSDSEQIAALLEKRGCRPAPEAARADLVVVNMCSVRQSAVDRILGLIPQLKKLKTQNSKLKTILTGCILAKDKEKFAEKFDFIFNAEDLTNWLKKIKVKIPTKTESKIQSNSQHNSQVYLPIMTGCNNFCSYCVVPYTRGREICFPVEKILREVKNLIKEGYKEIILLGQNVNSYISKFPIRNFQFSNKFQNSNSKTITINFPKLLKMINDIPGDFQIGFFTSHPKDFSDELIEMIVKSEKIKKEIHLPLQSGDNEILKKMNRGYTIENYLKLIEKIRKKISGVEISTDIIVGFPGETEKQFQNTLKICKKVKFKNIYTAQYSSRPGTFAFKMKNDVPQKEKKKRWEKINKQKQI